MRHLLVLIVTIGSVVPLVATAAEAPASAPVGLSIDLSHPIPPPITGQLKMGGKNPAGVEINANSRYLTLGGKPWVPVMGEFHFTRYPHEEWERELLKMKAGGITLVSTYVFWIHHEEVQGQFDWSGDRDLRAFLQLCAKHGLLAWVRLGPWCHGEVRNGGLPDWVLAECGKNIRKNDPKFMGFTRTLYQQIFKQCDGLLWKDGGPIIGVQLENEMSNNPAYLLALKRLAQNVGFDVPLYSVTGWGSVKFPADEVIPLFGGYADGFWEGGSTYSKKDRKQFFFTHVRDDSGIGADLMPATWHAAAAVELDRYPYVTCECGGGMETSYARRPLMSAGDVAALSFVKIGSGSNLPGYYMYHGGRNPAGKLSTLQESQATNYPNDMPVIRYDFQAPLGEFGQVRQSYDALRTIHVFLADFGEQLATMPAILPAEQPKSVDDTATLRWSARSDGHRGFVFINNYQRGEPLPERRDVQLTLKLADGDLTFPQTPANVPSGAYTIWPFKLDLNGTNLRYATAQLLCRIDDGGTPMFVFFAPAGTAAEFSIDGVGVIHPNPRNDVATTVHAAEGRTARVLLLTHEQAMHAYVGDIQGARHLVLSPDGNAIFDG
ncbi:MAG TPA: beta-galactosidase, partial [Tepidisphaeraceae bacterium]|nr:beta-galactosidase [Tepidisphaeraceae bacterium]